MSIEVCDLQVSGLHLVESAEISAPTSGKYQRTSIPYIPNRHCLGYLEGAAADFQNATRNGRKYPLELWKNVQNSQDFQEGMKCATIVGELDHPEERVDYSLTKGAVILTDFEIREDEGIVWCRFAILDNDEGKRLLSYVKFGTVLGVSSRGLGDEINYKGENCIDPETYEFYCFDVVAMPAAAVARQEYKTPERAIESTIAKQHFDERANIEIEKAESIEALNSLRSVIESTCATSKEALVEAITNKLSRLSESTDKQGIEGSEDAKADNDEGKQILLSNDALQRECNRLTDKLKRREENAKTFRKTIQEQRSEIESLEAAVSEGLDSISELSQQLESAQVALKASLVESEEFATELKRSKAESKRASVSNKLLRKHLHEATAKLRDCERSAEKLTAQVEALQTQKHEAQQRIVALESAAAASKSHASRKLQESKAIAASKDSQISSLRRRVENLTSQHQHEREALEVSLSEQQKQTAALESKLAKQSQASSQLFENYKRLCCDHYEMPYSQMKESLSGCKTPEDVQKECKNAFDQKQKLLSMHLSSTPSSGLVTEHSESDKALANSFLVEALRNGSK